MHMTKYMGSMTVSCGNKGQGGDNETRRPRGGWPGHWIDRMHEEEGGMYKFGGSIRDGRREMQEAIAGLMVREGVKQAWADTSNGWLDPKLVEEARAPEIHFLRKWACTPECRRRNTGEPGGR